jgi:lysophospholipid acyltransferase (LPLAT)-like uncharacterized protein
MRRITKSIIKSETFQNVIAFILSSYLKVVKKTSTWKVIGFENMDTVLEKQTCIACFWHGRMAMTPFMWRWPHKKLVALISEHPDGMLVARTFKRLSVDYVNGSTNKGGVRAFKTLMEVLARRDVVGIIPDGPRGPARKLSDGVVFLAKHSGQPIIPLAYATTRFITFKSWDRFRLPLPFSKGVFIYGKPIHIPQDIRQEEMERFRLQVEDAITTLENEADQVLGIVSKERYTETK